MTAGCTTKERFVIAERRNALPVIGMKKCGSFNLGMKISGCSPSHAARDGAAFGRAQNEEVRLTHVWLYAILPKQKYSKLQFRHVELLRRGDAVSNPSSSSETFAAQFRGCHPEISRFVRVALALF